MLLDDTKKSKKSKKSKDLKESRKSRTHQESEKLQKTKISKIAINVEDQSMASMPDSNAYRGESTRESKKKKLRTTDSTKDATSKATKKRKLSHDQENTHPWNAKTKVQNEIQECASTGRSFNGTGDDEIRIHDPLSGHWKRLTSFQQSGLDKDILTFAEKYPRPTPIQSVCIPVAMAGRHVIGIAETGSGKTMAFGLPCLSHIRRHGSTRRGRAPRALVMTPTRELALQIREQLENAGQLIGVQALALFGGMSKQDQRQALRQGVDIVIACPGRLLDLMGDGSCQLSEVDYVVLDEADRMLDMGFQEEVRQILAQTSAQRQVLMFSATWPQSIEKLAKEYLSNAVKVTIGSPDLGASQSITQLVEVLEPFAKDQRLLSLLGEYHSSRKNRVLVFALYKKEASRLEQLLTRRGWQCVSIHGDMNQSARNESFFKFKSGQVPLLIATDVAARGLDIPNVEYVVNYTFPLTIEDYVHRIGRTGRAGLTGLSHTFFTAHDKLRAGELVNLLRQTHQQVPDDLLKFGTTVKKKEHGAYGAFFKEIDPTVKSTKIKFDSEDEGDQ